MHHEDVMDQKQRELYEQMASLVLELSRSKRGKGWSFPTEQGECHPLNHKEPEQEEDEEDRILESLGLEYVVRLLRKMSCNGFTITDNDCQAIGIGLFLGAVAANHSCQSNCHALFEGTSVRLRTLRAVDQGKTEPKYCLT